MQTPYPPPTDRLYGVRVGIALLLTGSTLMLAISVVLRLHAIGQASEQLRIEQQEQAVLKRLESLKAEEDYQTCQQEAAQVPPESRIHHQALTLGNDCQQAQIVAATLKQSHSLANAGLLADAIAKVQTITDQSAASEVQQWVLTWSNQILQAAETQYQTGELQEAIRTANAIPSTSILYSQAQARIRSWQTDWATNQNRLQTAQTALAAHQREVALAQIQQITHPYWHQQARPLMQAAYTALADQPENDQNNDQRGAETPRIVESESRMLTAYAQLLLPVSLGLLIARLSLGQSSSE